jgi:hypothetical protein
MPISNSTQFIPKFMKILQMFQKLYIRSNRAHTGAHAREHLHSDVAYTTFVGCILLENHHKTSRHMKINFFLLC